MSENFLHMAPFPFLLHLLCRLMLAVQAESTPDSGFTARLTVRRHLSSMLSLLTQTDHARPMPTPEATSSSRDLMSHWTPQQQCMLLARLCRSVVADVRRSFLGGSAGHDTGSVGNSAAAINDFATDTGCALFFDGPFGNIYGASVTDFPTTFDDTDAIEILPGDEAVGCITLSAAYNGGAYTDDALATMRSGALRLRCGVTEV